MDHQAAQKHSKEDGFPSLVGRFACQVQWGDCDPAGIIFYPTYFRWMDAATWAFMDSIGGWTAAVNETVGLMVRASVRGITLNG